MEVKTSSSNSVQKKSHGGQRFIHPQAGTLFVAQSDRIRERRTGNPVLYCFTKTKQCSWRPVCVRPLSVNSIGDVIVRSIYLFFTGGADKENGVKVRRLGGQRSRPG